MAALNLTVEQGATFRRVFTLTDSAGAVINLTGATVAMHVRRTQDQESAELIRLTTENGRVSIVGASGQITLVLTSAETDLLLASGYYDLFVQYLAGDRIKLLRGVFAVEPRVTTLGS